MMIDMMDFSRYALNNMSKRQLTDCLGDVRARIARLDEMRGLDA